MKEIETEKSKCERAVEIINQRLKEIDAEFYAKRDMAQKLIDDLGSLNEETKRLFSMLNQKEAMLKQGENANE